MAQVERFLARGRDPFCFRATVEQDLPLHRLGDQALQEDDDLLGQLCQNWVRHSILLFILYAQEVLTQCM